MRNIDLIVVHCTATPEGRAVSVAEIDQWHKQRGWSGIGYHFVVHLDGRVEEGRPVSRVGAHVAGHNSSSIGVVYVGGLDKAGRAKDTRTPEQKKALTALLKRLLHEFPAVKRIAGHNEFSAKACPCFDARAEYMPLLSQDRTPAPSVPSTDPDTTLQRGDFGPAVRDWQTFLFDWGYRDIAIDGDFGSMSDQRTRWWQSARGLPVDGIVGPLTQSEAERVETLLEA